MVLLLVVPQRGWYPPCIQLTLTHAVVVDAIGIDAPVVNGLSPLLLYYFFTFRILRRLN